MINKETEGGGAVSLQKSVQAAPTSGETKSSFCETKVDFRLDGNSGGFLKSNEKETSAKTSAD